MFDVRYRKIGIKPLRSLADIRADILALKQETEGMMREVLEG